MKEESQLMSLNMLKETVDRACRTFEERLKHLESHEGGLTEERYVRYLSMQYHLTRGVQRHFMICASHSDMVRRPKLREFLIHFAIEEELHYKVAEKDLANMNREPGESPLDVRLWWMYFDGLVTERPFLRLGATCILENLSGGAGETITRLFKAAAYLTPKNTKFMVIHQHGDELPHGDQILEAMHAANLEPRHWADLVEGARVGAILYFRMAEWALNGAEATFAVPAGNAMKKSA